MINTATTHTVEVADAIKIPLDDKSVDLVFCSPPYEARRMYAELGFNRAGMDWVWWAAQRYMECLRVCRGLVAWVVGHGSGRHDWSAAPMLLAADLKRAGVKLRPPGFYHRRGIPGTGGSDGLAHMVEFIICATDHGKELPWSDNKAMGSPCKHKTGGAMSYRHEDGRRRNVRTGKKALGNNGRPDITNPGNFIDFDVVRGKVGKGHMGSDLAHEGEAPFPEWLAEFYIRTYCPPGGVVLDPFVGSGTTLAVAKKHGRSGVGFDIRQSQVDLTLRRLAEIDQ